MSMGSNLVSITILIFGLCVVGCGDSADEPSDVEDSGSDEQPDRSDSGMPEPGGPDCDCEPDVCGEHGACVCSGSEPICLCDSGYDGDGCGACEPGYARVGDACARGLTDVTPVAAGDECEHGGVAIERGYDADGNGELTSSEIDEVSYVCSAVELPGDGDGDDDGGTPAGACSLDYCGDGGGCVAATSGAVCVCSSGYAGARCDGCAAGFVPSSEDGDCKVPDRLVDNTPEPPGVRCADGGWAIAIGSDLDDDGVLDADEITSTVYDCRTPTVLNGNVAISNQAILNNLRGVTEITGTLTINARYVTDLEPLESLTAVGGSVIINNCHELEGLSGLEALDAIGADLRVHTNPVLRNLDGLSGLTELGGNLTLYYNDALESLDGLSSLARIGAGVTVEDNAALRSLDGLESLVSVIGDLRIQHNPNIETLRGLDSLQAVGGAFQVIGNDSLLEVDALGSLIDVGRLSFWTNVALTSLDGLLALRSVRGGLEISGNAALEQLDGFAALERVDGVFEVHDNGVISIDGFGELRSTGAFSISNNSELVSIGGFGKLSRIGAPCTLATPFPLPLPEPIGPLVCSAAGPSSFHIRDNEALESIDGFGSITEGVLAIGITDNELLERVADLGPLTEAQALEIAGNPALAQLGGFEELTTAASVMVAGTALTAFDLPALDTLAGAFTLADNVELESIDGFNLLEQVPGNLVIDGNTSVTSVAGFQALTRVGASMTFNDTAATTITGFDVLNDIYRALTVSGHSALDGDFFPMLETVDSDDNSSPITVADNAELSTLAFLDGVSSASGAGFHTITLRNNGSLASLAGLPTVRILQLVDNPLINSLTTLSLPRSMSTLRLEGSFTTLAGVSAISSLSTLQIVDNDALTSLATLDRASLNSLEIDGNDALTSVATPALNQVATITVRNNRVLTTLAGLLNPPVYNATRVTIDGNAALTSLGSLPLRNIPDFTITNNDALVSLAGMPSNAPMTWSRVTISGNDALTSLTTVTASMSTLVITNNPMLPACLVPPYRTMNGSPTTTNTGNDTTATCP